MTRETTTWTPAEAARAADAWDRIAVSRDGQADPYATHAWFDAWARTDTVAARRARVHVVLDDGVPVAIWPLVRRRRTWVSTNVGNAPRTRLVLAADQDASVVEALVEHVARQGVRHLRLHGLPSRDPGTGMLLQALRSRGYVVDVREGESDNVVLVAGSEAYERTVRKLVSSTRSRERRISPFWDVEVHEYGGEAGRLAEGMDQFDVVQGNSWKGGHRQGGWRRRRLFLETADRRGWVHLLVLTIAGRPAAGNIWFRLGDTAVGWSTCYDQQLAALAPGLLLHRHVQEAVRDDAPALLDVLPGPNPFKDSFEVPHAPLLTVEAYRGRGASRVLVRVLRRVSERGAPVAKSWWGRATGLRRRAAGSPEVARSGTERCEPQEGREAVAVTPLEVDATFSRYLAVAGGFPSAVVAAEAWGPDDRWFLVGDDRALARLSPASGEVAGVVREVVPLAAGVTAREVAGAVADALGRPVDLAIGAIRLEGPPPLPWVAALASPAATPD